jgi:mono/diheme cytochrome c family protein
MAVTVDKFRFLALLFLAAGASGHAVAEERPTYEQVRPLLAKHCYECHSNDKAKGDLNLERFENEDQIVQELALWSRAEGRMANKEMPPKTRPQPTDEEMATLNAWFSAVKQAGPDCDRLVSEGSTDWYPGYVMSRRLNRFEYENTLRDLLLVDIDLASRFPADGAGGEGFDTDGGALFLSAIQAEKYLDAADHAIEIALPQLPAPGDIVPASTSLSFDPFAAARRDFLIPVRPSETVSPVNAARASLVRFLERAWRRPVRPVEAGHVLSLAVRALGQGQDFDTALKLCYKAALVSPNFLFLAEPKPAENGVYELGPYQLASRLSYFLWSSMPDAELFALADSGELSDAGHLQRQIERMLLDPKAVALGEQFAAQWLGIYQLGETIKLDTNRFPEFDASLTTAMRQEAAQFFQGVFAENRSLLDLIDANYTYANEALARIYGIEGVTGTRMQRVQLADARRGGVLGMSAVLAATSQPLRTSPVLRGKWVLEQLLGDRVPPPPPNVPALPTEEKHADGLTLRQRLEAHRENPDCAGCHSRMDPLGFGLENFDPIGRWRDESGGQPVDARGELPSGEAFNGPAELKQILLARKDEFSRNLSRKMLGYALGRSLTHYDDCVVDRCVEALKNNGYQARLLVNEIVLSYPFRHRYSAAGS